MRLIGRGTNDRDATDSSDPTYSFTYYDTWRMVATYRDSDSSPKEQFVYHAAGLAGLGGSSYIDAVIFRDRDNTGSFDAASDGTLETRRFFAQNWRADVSAGLTDTGKLVERIKYSAYGTSFGLPASYDVRADIDLDGDIDTADLTAINTAHDALYPFGHVCRHHRELCTGSSRDADRAER